VFREVRERCLAENQSVLSVSAVDDYVFLAWFVTAKVKALAQVVHEHFQLIPLFCIFKRG